MKLWIICCSSSGSSRNWDKNGGKIQNQNLERDSPVIKVVPSPVGNLRCNSASSVTSSLDNIIFSDPYAELESQQHLSAGYLFIWHKLDFLKINLNFFFSKKQR